MKYVLQPQRTRVTGTINGEDYDGDVDINGSFLAYEHTDGLNYLNLEYRKIKPATWQ